MKSPTKAISTSRNFRTVMACPFINEYELAAIKLNELSNVVDLFIFVQGTHTFTGLPISNPSPLQHPSLTSWKSQNKFLRQNIQHKSDAWVEEEALREYMRSFILSMDLAPWDVVFIVDLDEIPAESAVLQAGHKLQAMHERDNLPLVYLELTYLRYNINFAPPWGPTWIKAFATTVDTLKTISCPLSDWRTEACGQFQRHAQPTIKDAGIHPSSFYAPEGVLQKLQSYSHAGDYKKNFTIQEFKELLHEGKDMEQDGRDLVRLSLSDLNSVDYLRPSTRKLLFSFSSTLEESQCYDVELANLQASIPISYILLK
jgi:hypothetical protein